MYCFSASLFLAKTKAAENGCIVWTATVNPRGYGQFMVKENGKHRCALAHRVGWQIAYGEIPKGLFVLHHCDNPACVNPHHLFLGNHIDNMRDMTAKKRHRGTTGKRVWYDRKGVKLSREIAEEIRNTIGTQKQIAEKYNINQSMVSLIKSGKAWMIDAPRRR